MERSEAEQSYLDWLQDQSWRFARKYADTSPHEYIIRTWDNVEETMFEAFAAFIRREGYDEIYDGREYTVYDLAGHKYWTMGNPLSETEVLNRRSYEGYDVLRELEALGCDPSEHVDTSEYEYGELTGAATKRETDS